MGVPGALLVAVALVVAGPAGCANRTDRRVDSLVQDYADKLGPEAVGPVRKFPKANTYRGQTQLEEQPHTANPPLEKLPFDEASPDRDTTSRLESYAEVGPDAQMIDLPAAFRIAQKTGREYLTAEEEYILASIRLLVERHRYGPRFFNDSTVAAAGSFDTTNSDTTIDLINELRVTQMLPYGGDVEARLIWNAAETLRENVAGEYNSATQLVLNANIPLLRDAGSIARESLIQAERNLVYAARAFERFRREFLVDIARDYFDLVAQQASIANQIRSLNSLLVSQIRTAARVEAGREAAFQTRRFEDNVLSARNGLINVREQFILRLDRFKVRLGLPIDNDIVIVPTEINIPEPEIPPAGAARLALEYRLDLQTLRDRIDDSRRDVANTRNQLLPDLDLAAGFSAASDRNDSRGNFDFDFKESTYNASVTFGLPLDREIERLNLRSSMIGIERTMRTFSQFSDNVIVAARAAVRTIDRSRFALDLAERRIEINRLLLEQLKLEERGSLEITDAEDDLLQSENDRDSAVRDLRISILEYLLSTGMMRVDREGQFLPLPGMGVINVERRPVEMPTVLEQP